jgi:ADP-ribose pyrophosphatase
LPSGQEVSDYYVIERKPFVLVVALMDGKLLMVRQYRPATEQFYLALPGGYVDLDETPTDAAVRELREETGYDAFDVRQIGELHPLPGYIRSAAYVVKCRAAGTPASSIDVEEIDEVIQVEWSEALAMIRRGEVKEMQAVAAILLAANEFGALGDRNRT